MKLPSREATLALAELRARRKLLAAHGTGDLGMIRKATIALTCAERARRECKLERNDAGQRTARRCCFCLRASRDKAQVRSLRLRHLCWLD
jgi:hypothetical protein